MYILERCVKNGPTACWVQYGTCGNRNLLERIRAGQANKRQWRIRRTTQSIWHHHSSASADLRKAG